MTKLAKEKNGRGKKLTKKLESQSKKKGLISHLAFETIDDEARGVLKQIVDLKEKDKAISWGDFAILARTNEVANFFVGVISQTQIPYQFVASRGLYSKAVILDVLAYLKLLDNYHESPAMFRILSLPYLNLDTKTIIDLNHLAYKKAWSLYYTCQNYQGHITLPLGQAKIITELLRQISLHTQLVKTEPVSKVIYTYLEESGYLTLLTLEENQYNREQLNFLQQFFKKVRAWEEETLSRSLAEFLQMMALEQEAGETGALSIDTEAGPDAIKIMTVHASKGLEFKYVFITNLAHLKFPSTERQDPIELPLQFIKEQLPQGDAHLQEERRLFYVALTRAKLAVYLTYAKDYGGVRERKASRFINEVNLAVQDIESSTVKEPETIKSRQEKVIHPIPKVFSFSQLKAYETCPRQYYYSHVIKLQSKGKASFSFGKTMHATLQKFFQSIINSNEKKQASLFVEEASGAVPTLKELLSFYQESWIDDWYRNAEEKEKYRQDGERILKEFYQKFEGNWPVPLFLEKGFNIKVKDYSLKGVLDRVDVLNNTWEIIDYKTGNAKDDKITFEDKKQLLIYQIAAEEVFQTKVKNLTFLSFKTLYNSLARLWVESLSSLKATKTLVSINALEIVGIFVVFGISRSTNGMRHPLFQSLILG